MAEIKREKTGLYVRISRDRVGAGLGVARQVKECTELEQRIGWNIIDTYPDNDKSAAALSKPREQYARLVEDIKAGRIDSIICWHSDRLTRKPREIEDVIELAQKHGIGYASVRQGVLDLDNTDDVLRLQFDGIIGGRESSIKASRLQAKHLELAEQGKRSSGKRTFGWGADTGKRRVIRDNAETVVQADEVLETDTKVRVVWDLNVLDEAEAEIIRYWTAKVIEHDQKFSLARACRALAKDGVISAGGKPFGIVTLKAVLIRWMNAGIREHKGEPMGDGAEWVDGELVNGSAVWPAIVSEEDLKSVRDVLMNPERRTYKGGPRKYLLSNLPECGRCGGVMQYGSSTKKATETRPAAKWESYRCISCTSGIGMEVTDTTIINTVARMLALPSPTLRAFVDAESDEVKALRAARRDVMANFTAAQESDLPFKDVQPLLARYGKERDEIDAEINRHMHRDALRGLLAGLRPLDPDAPIKSTKDNRQAVREAFESMELAARRAVVTALMRVRIAPWAEGKTRRADAIARIEITELDPATGEPVDPLEGYDPYADEHDTGQSVEEVLATA